MQVWWWWVITPAVTGNNQGVCCWDKNPPHAPPRGWPGRNSIFLATKQWIECGGKRDIPATEYIYW